MGTRVSFNLGAPDGLEGVFWKSDPRLFRDWAWCTEDEDPGNFSLELLCRLDRIVAEGPGSLAPADHHDAKIIDAIFDAFVGFYCDGWARSLLRLASDSMVYVRWYRQVQTRVELQCPGRTSLPWRHLLEGRAVGRPSTPFPYTPRDVVFRLGYWTAEEVRTLHADLHAAFPGAVRRIAERSRGRFARSPDDETAIEITLEATNRALTEETGLITTVA